MKRKPIAALILTLWSFGIAASAAAAPVPLHEASIQQLGTAMQAGTLTAEQLVQMSLARIEAYDKQGPQLRAVITLNPQALETARALDAERAKSGPRSPLHGIPVMLKDNIDTADMPTTAGSLLLEGSLPPDDAFLVQQLREAGAIILGKLNMSEFASGAMRSSIGGMMRNPHDTQRIPGGSSGGSGIATAAGYVPLTLGTDTGGSIRSPSAANGIVGLKPTMGALSRDGVVPLALSFDTAGPMARNVSDIALAMGVMIGVDGQDAATAESKGKYSQGFTAKLNPQALKGARIGVARDYLGADSDVDWVFESALSTLKAQGATLVDVKMPAWLLQAQGEFYLSVRDPEFKMQIADYLQTLAPQYPKTLQALYDGAQKIHASRADGAGPNPVRWSLFERELKAAPMTDYRYQRVKQHALALVRTTIEGMLAADKLDAIVYPTAIRSTMRIGESANDDRPSPTSIANLGGFPDLTLPAGMNGMGMPVNISFLGARFSEPRLIELGYSFEQATGARRLPVNTPPLEGEVIEIP